MVRKPRSKAISPESKPKSLPKPSVTLQACKDCGSTSRKVTRPGPRCFTCRQKARKGASAARRLTYVAKQYNLTPEAYEALRKLCPANDKGEPLCPICEKRRATQVDHWHGCCKGKTSCGKCVRGLLCGPCNKYLGLIGDEVFRLLNGVKYLKQFEEKNESVFQGEPRSGS